MAKEEHNTLPEPHNEFDFENFPNSAQYQYRYTETPLSRSASDVFWTAVALAEWDGDATVDFEGLSLSFRTPGDENKTQYSVSVQCFPSGAEECILAVHAHGLDEREKFSVASDVVYENTYSREIGEALEWDLETWRERLLLDSEYVDLPARLEITTSPNDALVTVNGIESAREGCSALANLRPGYYLTIAEAEGFLSEGLGLYYARVDGPLPSLFTYAEGIAPLEPEELSISGKPVLPALPRPLESREIITSGGTALSPPPKTMPKPVRPPGAPRLLGGAGKTGAKTVTKTGKKVVKGAVNGVVKKIAKKAALKVLGKALVPVGVALDIYAVGVVIKHTVDLTLINKEITEEKNACCCAWTRRDTVIGPMEEVPGKPGDRMVRIETFSRTFYRTAPKVGGKCECGNPPTFARVPAFSEHVAPGQFIVLPAGPPTQSQRTFPCIHCPATGESTPSSINSVTQYFNINQQGGGGGPKNN
ncbi:MAG: hypothetical protein NPIRA02_35300 [Nitrospirales bacterium]|nr:MAG: hypothetical protein NPIRA02_35300 [Nitrospirales bacterium]